jgi:hypothetical protein
VLQPHCAALTRLRKWHGLHLCLLPLPKVHHEMASRIPSKKALVGSSIIISIHDRDIRCETVENEEREGAEC